MALKQRDFCIFLLFYYTKQQQQKQTLPYTGTRPALTMSVPVRYSAAAEYAVVDSGLDNTLTQEEQYHQQQQQLHLHQQQLEHQQLQYAQYQQQQQQEEEEALLYCQLQQQLEAEQQALALRQQQEQLMQQRSSMLMSSTVMPSLDLPHNNNHNITNNNSNHNINNANNNMDAISINAILVDDEQPSTSAQAAAAILRGESINGGGMNLVDHNAEMPTDWMRIADEGRYGTPGAAGLEYQKYEQQQQQQTLETEAAAGQGAGAGAGAAEPTALKKLEDQLHALSSDELYETLKEYDVLQDKYHTVLLLPKESRVC